MLRVAPPLKAGRITLDAAAQANLQQRTGYTSAFPGLVAYCGRSFYQNTWAARSCGRWIQAAHQQERESFNGFAQWTVIFWWRRQ